MLNFKKLTPDQITLRRRILEISHKKHLSHLGSCLSSVDIISTIYNIKKKSEPFILSNGHAGVALYAVLEKNKFINEKQISQLNIHPDRNLEQNIYVSTGSLGQGLPIALGMAFSNRKKNVYCMISDGEATEGSIWEALRVGSEYNLLNLKIVLNANGWGAYSSINLSKLNKRVEAFGWNTKIVDGHDMKTLAKALKLKMKKPLLIFAHTQVNQLPFLKGQDAHYYVMTDEDYEKSLKLLK